MHTQELRNAEPSPAVNDLVVVGLRCEGRPKLVGRNKVEIDVRSIKLVSKSEQSGFYSK